MTGDALPRRRLFLTFPQPLSCAAKTPATLANNCCLLPERGNSRNLHNSCNWSRVDSAMVSGLSFLGSWFKCNHNRCRFSLIEPERFIPNIPSISPSSLFGISCRESQDKSVSDRASSLMSRARNCSTLPDLDKS